MAATPPADSDASDGRSVSSPCWPHGTSGERIIAMSRHAPRQKLALEFGATDIVEERGDEGVARIKDSPTGSARTR
jgi:hypothetical protein